MKAPGPDWGFRLTDVTKGREGNDERIAFLFDRRRVRPSGLACEFVVPLESEEGVGEGAVARQFARSPYCCSFLSAGRTVILATLHVLYGDEAGRKAELVAIAEWLAEWAEREEEWNHNLIALGDFNIDRQGDELYDAFTSTGLVPAPALVNLARTIFDRPGTEHFYDQIAWFEKKAGGGKRPVLALTPLAGGSFDFVQYLYPGMEKQRLSWKISDHYRSGSSSRYARQTSDRSTPGAPANHARRGTHGGDEMASYVKSLSFNSSKGVFNSEKDDAQVNAALDHLRRNGAEIRQVDTLLSASDSSYTLAYVVHYDAPGVVG